MLTLSNAAEKAGLSRWEFEDLEVIDGIDAFQRKKEYRELGNYREVWGSWRDDGYAPGIY